MTDTIPLFPLGTVLLPGATLPLHIFEQRYRQLVSDLVTEVVPDRIFGVLNIRQGWEVGEGNVEALREIGCTASLDQVQQLPDQRYNITAIGQRRFRLLQIDTTAAPYLMARVEWLEDSLPEDDSAQLHDRVSASALAAHARYHHAGLGQPEGRERPDTGRGTDDLAYALAEDCVLPVDDRQALLAESDPLERLRMIRTMIVREAEFLKELRAIPASLSEFAHDPSTN